MPIYEFKCRKCNEYIEILIMGSQDDAVEMKCSKCGSHEIERILSSSNISVAGGTESPSPSSTQTRTCSNGSCTTWNLSGHSR